MQQNYNSVDEESTLLGSQTNALAPEARSASATKLTVAAVSALVLLGLGAALTSAKSGAAFTASTELAAGNTGINIFQDAQGAWAETGKSNWNDNKGDVKQLGSGIWVGDACWNNNEAVTGLEYKNDGNNFYWRYQCSGPLYANGQFTPVNFKQAGPGSGSSQSSGGLAFLDRQHAFCDSYSYLNGFKFDKTDGGDLKLTFNCINFWNQNAYYQTDYYSGWNDRGTGINYLDRHSMKCPGGSAISGFEGITGTDQTKYVVRGSIPGDGNGKFQFHYICATAKLLSLPSPTPIPTRRPTAAPSTVLFGQNSNWKQSTVWDWTQKGGAVKNLAGAEDSVDCRGGQALAGFHLKVLPSIKINSKGDMRDQATIEYKCTIPVDTDDNRFIRDTAFIRNEERYSGDIQYMDRQKVPYPSKNKYSSTGYPDGLPDYTYLSALWFRDIDLDGGQLEIDFTYVNYENQGTYRVMEKATNWDQSSRGINFLDRHTVLCDDGWALTYFEGQTQSSTNDAKSFRFVYRCASASLDIPPSPAPISRPTRAPVSVAPTPVPISDPTRRPVPLPTAVPSPVPISDPTLRPIPLPTDAPIARPTVSPSPAPVADPTNAPIAKPTASPISKPTVSPVSDPTVSPISNPTVKPVSDPTTAPSPVPISSPTDKPVADPTASPVSDPTFSPTLVPISEPTVMPSPVPISEPSLAPISTNVPISDPTTAPTIVPISDPTEAPSPVPIALPTFSPVSDPTESPVADSTEAPSPSPIADPTEAPVAEPTEAPVDETPDAEDVPFVPGGSTGGTGGYDAPADEYTGIMSGASPSDSGESEEGVADNIRPFVFTKGVTPEVPPAGVVLVADKDINFLKPGQISNAAYIIGPATGINGDSLAKDVLVNKVSTIVPGAGTKATFYSGVDLNGLEYTFTPKTFQALTNFHYHGSKAGNDEANSIFVSSTVEASLPQVALRTRILRA